MATSTERVVSKLAETKLALYKKYMNLARISNSKPRRVTFLNKAERYRRQALEYSAQ